MQFQEAYDYLLNLPRWEHKGLAAYHPGTAVISELLAAMDNPQERFRSVLVAGTNGKGSTASFIAAGCTSAGLKTGLHTSPHITDFSERMRVDGVPADHEWLAHTIATFRSDIDRIRPTFFEAAVALSLKSFAVAGVDIAVVEVGMGGRLDATNILDATCSVITRIGLDHMDVLGVTLDKIAEEKAGIVKLLRPVVMARQERIAADVIRRAARDKRAPLVDVEQEVAFEVVSSQIDATTVIARTPTYRYQPLVVGLPGAHQLENAGAALRALEILLGDRGDSRTSIQAGFENVRKLTGLEGRCETIQRHPLVIVDVAHNPEGLRAALAHARSVAGPYGHITVLIGLMRDKDAYQIGNVLRESGVESYVVGSFTERAFSAEELTRIMDVGSQAAPVRSAEEAIERFRREHEDGILLAVGSHHVVSSVKRAFHAGAFNTISS